MNVISKLCPVCDEPVDETARHRVVVTREQYFDGEEVIIIDGTERVLTLRHVGCEFPASEWRKAAGDGFSDGRNLVGSLQATPAEGGGWDFHRFAALPDLGGQPGESPAEIGTELHRQREAYLSGLDPAGEAKPEADQDASASSP